MKYTRIFHLLFVQLLLIVLGCSTPRSPGSVEDITRTRMPRMSFADTPLHVVLSEMQMQAQRQMPQSDIQFIYLSTDPERRASLRFAGGPLCDMVDIVCMIWNLRSVRVRNAFLFWNPFHGTGLHPLFIRAATRNSCNQRIIEDVRFIVREPAEARLESHHTTTDGHQIVQMYVPTSVNGVEMGGKTFYELPVLTGRIVLDVLSAGYETTRYTIMKEQAGHGAWVDLTILLKRCTSAASGLRLENGVCEPRVEEDPFSGFAK